MPSIPKLPADVHAAISTYPEHQKNGLLSLRTMIFETARHTDGVGFLTETLKWGQPSYLTLESRSGSTVRIDRFKSDINRIALFVHCQTSLILQFRDYYGDKLTYDGKRAVHFNVIDPLPDGPIRHCIALALTYHLNK